MNILLFGANGYLGKSLFKVIGETYENFYYYNRNMDQIEKQGNKVPQNSLFFDYVVIVSGHHGRGRKKHYEVNFEYQKKIYEKIKDKFSKVIYVSSINAFMKSIDSYAHSKYLGETFWRETCQSDCAILRPSWIISKDEKKLSLIKNYCRMFKFALSISSGKFAPVYVGDVCMAILELIKCDQFKERSYYIVGNEIVSRGMMYRLVGSEKMKVYSFSRKKMNLAVNVLKFFKLKKIANFLLKQQLNKIYANNIFYDVKGIEYSINRQS